MRIYNELVDILGNSNLKVREELKELTYSKLGGIADYIAIPKNIEQLKSIILLSKVNKLPLTVIGNGSNLIIRDGGLRGIVVSLINFNEISQNSDMLTIQSGVKIVDASNFALDKSLTGLEFSCGIPGTIGGGIYMNAGAYGGEFKDIIISCKVIDLDGNIKIKLKDDLNFDYRYSSLQDSNEIILEGVFKLNFGDYDNIKIKMDHLDELRKSKQPLEYPSCGSIFKRPEGNYAGKLISDCELQGKRIGGAEISKKHAGFIVNVDNAKADDYIKLINTIQNKVKQQFNINLEREVKIIGEEL